MITSFQLIANAYHYIVKPRSRQSSFDYKN